MERGGWSMSTNCRFVRSCRKASARGDCGLIWTVSGDRGANDIVDSDGNIVATAGGYADARLIAAAPELYKALRSLLYAAQGDNPSAMSASRIEADAALTKAETALTSAQQ